MKFKTKSDATDAGFVSASRRSIETIHGFNIFVADRSGGNSFGYDYSIAIRVNSCGRDEDIDSARAAIEANGWGDFAHSEHVELTEERNRAGNVGAVAMMFSPENWEAGIAAARQAIERAKL